MADEFDNMDTGGTPDSMTDDPPPICRIQLRTAGAAPGAEEAAVR